MDHKDFMKKITDYYGKYQLEAVGELTYLHIQQHIPAKKLPALFAQITKTIPARFNYVPDIMAIEKAMKELRDVEDREFPAYKKLPMPTHEDMDKVGAFWRKLREKYPSREDKADRLEEARRELANHRRKK